MYIDPTTKELLENDTAVSDAREYLNALYETYKDRYDKAKRKLAWELWDGGKRKWGSVEWQGLVNTISDIDYKRMKADYNKLVEMVESGELVL